MAATNSQPARIEHRRSKRFPVVVPTEVKWRGAGGANVREYAQAEEINAQGGLLRMDNFPNVGDMVELTNLLSTESVQARVLGMRNSPGEAVPKVAVELLAPSESFWGANFQLKKTTAELLKLGQALHSSAVELPILKEFREALDHIRKVSWAAEEWGERRLQRRNPDTVLSLLTGERIRRATYLCNELAAELETREVSFGTKGIAEFYRAIDRVFQSLERSCTSQ